MFVSGKLGFLNWIIFGDDFHVTQKNILNIYFPESIESEDLMKLEEIEKEFIQQLKMAYQTKLNCGKTIGSYNIASLWDITDKVDRIILKYVPGLTEEILYSLYNEVVKTAIAVYKE